MNVTKRAMIAMMVPRIARASMTRAIILRARWSSPGQGSFDPGDARHLGAMLELIEMGGDA